LGVVLITLLAVPSSSLAKPPSTPAPMDTATATGDNVVTDRFSSFNINVNAFSGPSGENPGGSVSFEVTADRIPVSGPVDCLNVNGKTAIMTIAGPFPSLPGLTGFLIRLTDNGGSGVDRFEYFPLSPENEPVDCYTGTFFDFGGALIGRTVVFDAEPLPATAEQCKNGGWAPYGFENQGQCVTFVERGPKD